MRKITKTRTGNIISDTDLSLEYLFVGDYGKENNIKASFLGYNDRIEKVEHKEVKLEDKLVVTVSTQKGCPMKCNFCDCPKLGFHGNVKAWEIVSEISTAIALSKINHGKRLNVHYARMGEPTFNFDVITATEIIGSLANQTFEEFHPVVSTMCPKNNKRLVEFLDSWTALMSSASWNGGIGLQFSINTLDEADRNAMFRNMSLSLEEFEQIQKRSRIYLKPDDFKSLGYWVGRNHFVFLADIQKYGKEEAVKNHSYTIKWEKETLNLDNN